MKQIVFLLIVFFVFLYCPIQVFSQEKINIIKDLKEIKRKKKNLVEQIGILPIRKKTNYRGQSIRRNEKFSDILKSRYKTYYEDSKLFAFRKGRVIEIFPK